MAGRRGGGRIHNPIRIVYKERPPKPEKPQEKGRLVVSGVQEIDIKTKSGKQPKRVWISLEEGGALPVCGGGMDKIGAEITENGFVMYVDIQSTERSVKWYAEL